MELEFKINSTIIEEPIGFDNFKTTIERGSEHGISAEVSMDSLEFYGVGFGVVNTAYNTDLDTQLTLTIGIKCDDNATIFDNLYTGLIDLSTYEELNGDYCSCSCKVGEIGQMTTFNNRVETEINLVDGIMKDLDGVDLPTLQLSKNISVPCKLIRFTNSYFKEDDSALFSTNINNVNALNATVPFGSLKINELAISNDRYVLEEATGVYASQFQNKQPLIDGNLFTFNSELKFSLYIPSAITFTSIGALFALGSAPSTYIWSESITPPTVGVVTNYALDFSIPDLFIAQDDFVYVQIIATTSDSGESQIDLKVLKDSFLKIYGNSTTEPSPSKIVLPIDAFSRLADIKSGLTVKSDWYNNISGFGGGALKGLINGYQLRGSTLIETVSTLLTTSFKQLFLDLKAIDNIGWGFVYESGILYLRIENWKWFYKNETIFEITNPSEINRQLDVSKLTSRFKVGYSKYAAIEDINSVDTFHTERNYSNGLKAVDKELVQLCKLIADPYSIEFTRRKYFDKTTEAWKFDENTFVIALKAEIDAWDGIYVVDQGVISSGETMISPETMTNFRITPFRNACKFTDIIKQGNLSKQFNLTSGTGNLAAIGEPVSGGGYYYLLDSADNNLVAENDSLTLTNEPILKPEIITVEYPLSYADHKYIKANPYGEITVDGEICYLKKLEFSPMEGKAKFILIPKVV